MKIKTLCIFIFLCLVMTASCFAADLFFDLPDLPDFLQNPSDFSSELEYYSYLNEHGYLSENDLSFYKSYLASLETGGTELDLKGVPTEVEKDNNQISDISETVKVQAELPQISDISESDGLDLLDSSPLNLMSLSPVPSSGNAQSDPQILSIVYAPDAQSGSFLDVLYSFFGKPVSDVHYRWITNNTSGSYAYSVQHYDYDVNWLCSVAFFALLLFCILKAFGGLLCRK